MASEPPPDDDTTTMQPDRFEVSSDSNETAATSASQPDIPAYVCCAVTEGVWTWFGASLLIVVLFGIATLKYYRKRLSKPRFREKNHDLLLQYVLADDEKAVHQVKSQGPISVENFPQYYAKRRKHRTIDKLEYAKIVETTTKHSWSCARQERNAKKNQSPRSVPFDYNRVKLVRSEPSSKGDDYINASHIRYPDDPVGVIVCQGPLEQTLADFWLLVWQSESRCLIMLTKTYELIKVMCHQYWPIHLDKPEKYGEFTVTTNWEEVYAHYKVRELTVSREGNSEQRQILHYHYQEWPAYANPAPNSLIQFRRRLKEDLAKLKPSQGSAGPPVIHCHEGGARSGTFLAIDMLLNNVESAKDIDVFSTVKTLMEQRAGLIASSDNLRYIYDVVEDHILCGETFIAVEEILPRLQQKSKKDPHSGVNTYTKEHRLLDSLLPRFTIGDCAAGHRVENRAMNRNVLVVPPDSSRPYLTSFQSNESTDYINAVLVDGYRRADEFICTEWPMSNTMAAFWSMVYDHDIRTVVVLNHPPRNSAQFPPFWPASVEEKKKHFSPVFCVEWLSQHNVDGRFDSWNLRVLKNEVAPHKQSSKDKTDLSSLSSLLKSMQAPAKNVRLFQIQCWPAHQKVPNSTLALVNLLDEVEHWRGNVAGVGKSVSPPLDKVVVVSTDGVSRCGIYCVAAACLEQVYHRSEVDVFQAVKTVRKHRPQLVAHPLEYKYCYDLVLHYVLNYCRPNSH